MPVDNKVENLYPPYLIFLSLAAITLFSLVYQGVYFGLGEGDHSIHIPFIRYFNDPSLYPHDLLVGTANQYFTYYLKIIAAAARVVPLATIYYSLHCLSRLAWISALYYLGRTWSLKQGAALLGTAMLALPKVFFHFTPISMGLIHSSLAWPLLLLSLAFFWQEFFIVSFVIAGLTFNLHPLLTAYLVIIFAGIFLVKLATRKEIRLLKIGIMGAIIFVALAWPTLGWMLNSLSQTTTISPQWQALNLARHKHFAKPGAWSITVYLEALSLFLLFLLGVLKTKKRRRDWLIYGGCVTIMTLIGLPFFPWQMTPFLFKAQFIRASQFLYFPAFLLSAGLLFDTLQKHPSTSLYFLTSLSMLSLVFMNGMSFSTNLIFFTSLLFFLGYLYYYERRKTYLLILLAGCLLAVIGFARIILIAVYLPPDHYLNRLYQIKWLPVTGVLLTAVLLTLYHKLTAQRIISYLCLGLAVLVLGGLVTQQMKQNQIKQNNLRPWKDVQLWAKQNTPIDSVFITPPQLDGWQVFSQRSGVFDYKSLNSIHYAPESTDMWIARLNDYGYDLVRDARRDMRRLLAGNYKKFSPKYFQMLANKYGASYLITTTKLPFTRIYQNKRFNVYQLLKSKTKSKNKKP